MASESIFNYFVGGLALLSTAFSMLVYLNVYLPGPRMKAFDSLLAETKEIYEKARGEDLLPPEMSRQAQAKLRKFETQGDELRAAVYHNLSPCDILLSFFSGQSTKIADLSWDVKRLRRDVLTASQKERARRQAELLEQERNSSMRHDESQPTGQHNHGPDGTGFSNSRELRRSTIECADTTSDPSISDSISPSHRSVSRIRSTIRWFSEMFSRTKPPSHQPRGDGEQAPSIHDMETHSRSSTLVEEPMPKDSSMPLLPSLLGRWVRSVDVERACDDLEAGRGVPRDSSVHDSRNSSCDLAQVDLETMSSV